ncbi:MAG TPA: Tex family protein [Bellilinea sp.]|nr:Tex family protein [Bellilinea sp.]
MEKSYPGKIAEQLSIRPQQVSAVIEMLDEGNTIPFIARYRKERTGSLDEEQLRQIQSLLEKMRALDERRTTILASIEEQGKMTDELREKITAADNITLLEDLYAPYKPKRRTRASIAREKGLQPLADFILKQFRTPGTPEDLAKNFINETVFDEEEALAGARDIVAETISEDADVRTRVREKALMYALVKVEKIDDAIDERKVFEVYYAFESRVDRLRPHQILAINRGETEKILRIKVEVAAEDWSPAVHKIYRPDSASAFASHLEAAIQDAAERLLLPAIERDVRRHFSEVAEQHAIKVFAENLRALLGQPPLIGHTVLGIDPGFRTGCKIAVVDATGKMLDTTTIYPHEPQKRSKEALATLLALIKKYHVTLITIGNGTASRESEQLAAELLRIPDDAVKSVRYLITNEAGASVYSASPLARAELPTLDVSLRGAVSIARRVQDPLAELVKIDPKSIGVGLYQHDVDQSELTHSLEAVVEDVVNWVGVDANTASPALLTHVSGIGPKLAETIVAYRDENGPFASRAELRRVPKLGEKTFVQSAGFLRIINGKDALDATAIHPESYPIARKVLERAKVRPEATPEERRRALALLRKSPGVEVLAEEMGAGVPTLTDIFDQLARPGRDPRADAPAPILRSDVLKMEDLTPGMRLKGTVRNVVDFGAFVDIGVKQDGLLHRSQLPRETILRVGDVIDVEVLKVETDRGRIGLKWPGY